jgi:hypothetical protein
MFYFQLCSLLSTIYTSFDFGIDIHFARHNVAISVCLLHLSALESSVDEIFYGVS